MGLISGKLINPNAKHYILRPSFGTLYKFQGILNHSVNRYYITTKLIIPKKEDVFIKEVGHIHNFTLNQNRYMPLNFLRL